MASRTVANLTAVISANNTKFKKGVGGARGVLKSFKKSIMGIGPAIAGAFAVSSIVNFGKESLRLYNVQAQAEKQLLVALKGREDAQRRLMAQASRLQSMTLFGDEETIRAQALIAAFVKEEEQIEQIIPLVQDLATAKGMDLAGAADLVSKTLGSSTNALSRYGIQVEGTVGSTQRLESLMEGLNDAFGGQAKAAAETGTGSLIQLQNAMGDLKESIGAVINQPLAEWARTTTTRLTIMTSDVLTFREKIGSLFSPGAEAAALGMAVALQGVGESAEELDPADRLLKRVEQDKIEAALAAEELKKKTAEERKEWEKLNEELVAARMAKTALLDIDLQLRDSMNETLTTMKGTHEEFMSSVAPTDQLSNSLFELGMEFADLDEEMIVEPEVDALVDNFRRGEMASKKFREEIGRMAVSLASDLAYSLGEVGAGAKTLEEALSEISAMIVSALGDILITVGLSTSPIGIPFILAGLALKGISGLMRGSTQMSANGNIQTGFTAANSGGGPSTLRGNDIRLANNYSTNLYDRIG